MRREPKESNPTSDAWRFVGKLVAYLLVLGTLCAVVQSMAMHQVRAHLGVAASMTLLKREWIRDGWVQFPEGKTGVIALGDSRMLAAMSPLDFDGATEGSTHTFNLSLPASTSDAHRAVLEEVISSGDIPEWIILGLAPNTPFRPDTASYRSIGIANPRELLPVLKSNPEWRKILIDWLLPIRRFQTDLTTWLNRLVFKRNEIDGRNVAAARLAEQLVENRGMYAKSDVLKLNPGEEATPNYLNINPDVDPANRELLELAAAHGIKVLLVSGPVRPGELIRNPETAALAATVADGLPGIFISPGYFDPMVLSDYSFSDLVHVNLTGSKEFSRQLALEFMNLPKMHPNDSIPASQQEP